MNISRDHSIIEESTNCDIELQSYSWNKKEKWHETFQDYKSHDNLSQADTISEGLTQESTNSLFEESSQESCSYTLIEDSDHE
ncbi:19921_t:CDS:2, partial [Racocetra fulgida]